MTDYARTSPIGALGCIDLGFKPENMLTMRVSIPAARYDTPENVVNVYRQLTEKVRGLPGVESSGFLRVLPLATTTGDPLVVLRTE